MTPETPTTDPLFNWTSRYKVPRPWKTVAIVFFAVVYLGGTTGRWWPSNDSAIYLGLGRSLAEGQGYVFNGEPNNTFTPGLPLLLAGVRLLGDRTIWGPNLLMALSGVAALWLIYVVLKRATGDEMLSLLIAVVCGASYDFYLNAHRVLTDMPCTALFWLLLWCLLRVEEGRWTWIALCGLVSAVTIAIRAPALLLLGPLALGILLDNWLIPSWRKRLAAAMAIGLAALLTAGFFFLLARHMNDHAAHYVKLMTPRSGPYGFWTRFIHGLAKMPAAAADVFTAQPSAWPAGVLFLIAQVIGAVRCWKRGRRSIVIVAFLYPMLLAVSLGTFGMRGRYMMPAAPLMLLLGADGVCWVAAKVYEWHKHRGAVASAAASSADVSRASRPLVSAIQATPALFGVVVAIYAGASFFSSGPRSSRNAFYYVPMAYTHKFYHAIREGHYAELINVAGHLAAQSGEGLVGTSSGDVGVLHYLSGRQIVPVEEPGQAAAAPNPDATESAPTDPQAARDLLARDSRVRFVVLNLPRTIATSATQPDALPGLKILYRDGTYVLTERG